MQRFLAEVDTLVVGHIHCKQNGSRFSSEPVPLVMLLGHKDKPQCVVVSVSSVLDHLQIFKDFGLVLNCDRRTNLGIFH